MKKLLSLVIAGLSIAALPMEAAQAGCVLNPQSKTTVCSGPAIDPVQPPSLIEASANSMEMTLAMQEDNNISTYVSHSTFADNDDVVQKSEPAISHPAAPKASSASEPTSTPASVAITQSCGELAPSAGDIKCSEAISDVLTVCQKTTPVE